MQDPLVVVPADAIPEREPTHHSLCATIFDFDAVAPVAECVFDLKDALTRDFQFKLTLVDGRVWKQHLFVLSSCTRMTFDAGPQWSNTEFSYLRALWELGSQILRAFPAVTRLKYS